MNKRNLGVNLVEYSLPLAIVGLTMVALSIGLGASLRQGLPGLISSDPLTTSSQSMSVRPLGEHPALGTVSFQIENGSTISLTGLPINMGQFVDTVGSNGIITQYAKMIESIAEQLKNDPNATPADFAALKALSNSMFAIANVAKPIEDAAAASNGDKAKFDASAITVQTPNGLVSYKSPIDAANAFNFENTQGSSGVGFSMKDFGINNYNLHNQTLFNIHKADPNNVIMASRATTYLYAGSLGASLLQNLQAVQNSKVVSENPTLNTFITNVSKNVIEISNNLAVITNGTALKDSHFSQFTPDQVKAMEVSSASQTPNYALQDIPSLQTSKRDESNGNAVCASTPTGQTSGSIGSGSYKSCN